MRKSFNWNPKIRNARHGSTKPKIPKTKLRFARLLFLLFGVLAEGCSVMFPINDSILELHGYGEKTA
jgi:hypothetical protein